MKQITTLIFLFLVFGIHFASAQPRVRGYVGFRYKGVLPNTKLPNGVKHLGGSLIGNINADPVYGISMVSKARSTMLWLEVSTGKNARGVSDWRVLDVLSFNNRRANDHVLISGDPAVECTRNGKAIEDLSGIGTIVRKQGIFRPSALWVANLKTLRFDPISKAGIKCVYSEP